MTVLLTVSLTTGNEPAKGIQAQKVRDGAQRTHIPGTVGIGKYAMILRCPQAQKPEMMSQDGMSSSTSKPLKQRLPAASSVPVSCLIIAFLAARSVATQPRISPYTAT